LTGPLLEIEDDARVTMTKIEVHLRAEEFAALAEVARRSGKSVAELVREAVGKVWLRPESRGPVALWDGEPRPKPEWVAGEAFP
jgi:hypothetical protein